MSPFRQRFGVAPSRFDLAAWREANPNIVQFWRDLEDAAREATFAALRAAGPVEHAPEAPRAVTLAQQSWPAKTIARHAIG